MKHFNMFCYYSCTMKQKLQFDIKKMCQYHRNSTNRVQCCRARYTVEHMAKSAVFTDLNLSYASIKSTLELLTVKWII